MTQTLFQDLQERRLIHQTSHTSALAKHLATGSRTLYCGFDPTAESLHLGHLLPLLVLKRFQQQGHKPIILIGGATGLIGDPSGKEKERLLNSAAITNAWAEKIQAQTSRYLDFSSGSKQAMVVNNLDWIGPIKLLDFLHNTGKHFAINTMIQKESVRLRIERKETGISFTEFSYMLLQALDYAELAKRYDCTLQVGGSDQWGNITAGLDLIRKTLRKTVYALTLPLITKADGKKFGKSDGGEVIWLNPKKTSPYQFYQFWINTTDKDLNSMLAYFTSMDALIRRQLMTEHTQAPEHRKAQKQLAQEITELVHGKNGLQSAERITRALFEGVLDQLNADDFAQLEQDGLPCIKLDTAEKTLRSAFSEVGLTKSTNTFKDALNRKAINVNGHAITDFNARFNDLTPSYGHWYLLRLGKRKWGLATLDQ